jgi:hypothetical protein
LPERGELRGIVGGSATRAAGARPRARAGSASRAARRRSR